ncbi:MAG: RecQ family ATP-dependent DNA helicase [Bacteroidetes bacterium]|nr:MAG: RecQ family ATP-dependent DNA helicase [Bacteroidota bacterium]
MATEPLNILKEYWGFDTFRPLQEEIIQSVLEGYDTLALMPTGGGKSICFQVPALARDGVCVVVSPLIALMKDQVYNLHKRNIPAVAIYSGMHPKDIDRLLDNCVYGHIKFLYLSPERLVTELARERLKNMPVNLLAVDEAHCVSQWGYDFRPPYLRIAEIRELLPNTPILALTATATPEVVKDIQEKLMFKKGRVFRKSFARPNLAYVVLQEADKHTKMLDILRKVPGSGIVYVRSRRGTKDIARLLVENGISADFYHAGLSPEVRAARQEAWIRNQTRVMVCTNAFGMGIDKPNVRTVIHMDVPDSLEAYFQEAGRAGRDGKKSYAVLLWRETDKQFLERNYDNAYPPIEEIRRVYRALGSYFQLAVGGGAGRSFDFDMAAFCKNFQFEPVRTFHALKVLEQSGWIVMTESVFVPSTLKIRVNKDQLYDFQLKNPKLDPVLKTILRLTQGAFTHFVNVRESKFAGFLKMPTRELVQALRHLHNANIIEYRPRKDKPQIVFLEERTTAENLLIDHETYLFRKKRHRFRIQKVIEYAETPHCRSRLLLRYFGEKDSAPCGVCDVCLGRTKTQLSSQDYERYKNKIALVLRREQLTTSELLEAFKPRHHELVLKTLEFMLDEALVERDGEKLVLKI